MASQGSYLIRAHLHPLTFALDALDKLDSLSLSLVQFHLDNDEPGFDRILDEARKTWISRRQRAVFAGERLEGQPAPPPSAPPSRPTSNGLLERLGGAVPQYPPVFQPLVETLRFLQLHGEHKRPLKSMVGIELKKRDPEVYQHNSALGTFKLYVAEAERLGLVKSFKGGNNRDWMLLQEPYLSGISAAPVVSPASLPPPMKPPLPNPLPPSLFHLSDLAFPWTLATIASLPSHQLLLLQFRDDVLNLAGTSAGQAVHEAIDNEFWQRRSASTEAGEEWHAPPSSAFIPRSDFQQALPAAPVASSGMSLARPQTTPSSAPDLRSPLPRTLAAGLHLVEVGNLAPTTIAEVRLLVSLLGPRLLPSAAILYRADQRDPSAPPARRAHIAYRSAGLAGAAQAHLTSLNLDEGGVRYPVTASMVDSRESQPRWEWGDVLEPVRTEMWAGHVADGASSEGKRSRDNDDSGDYGKKRKIDSAHGPPQRLSPSSLVPTSSLSRLYGVSFSLDKIAQHLKNPGDVDDAFVHRFGAVAYRQESPPAPNGVRYVLLFSSGRDATGFQRWVHDTARVYWKYNGIRTEDLSARDVQRQEWHQSDFTPSWRAEHNIVLENAPGDDRPIAPTVGQIGRGRNIGEGERVGYFFFEYKLKGLPNPPSTSGPSLASRFAPLPVTGNRWGRGSEDADSVRSASLAPSERAHSPSTTLASRLPPGVQASSAAAASHRSASPASSHPSADSSASLLPAPPAPSASALSIRGSANGRTPVGVPTAAAELDPEVALASPLSSVSSAPAVPTAAQEDLSLYGPSALALARLSPTLALDASKAGRASRSRRPTATSLNDFEQDLDQLFAGAEVLIGTNVVKTEETDEDVEMEDALASEVKQEDDDEEQPVKTALVVAEVPVASATGAEEDLKPTAVDLASAESVHVANGGHSPRGSSDMPVVSEALSAPAEPPASSTSGSSTSETVLPAPVSAASSLPLPVSASAAAPSPPVSSAPSNVPSQPPAPLSRFPARPSPASTLPTSTSHSAPSSPAFAQPPAPSGPVGASSRSVSPAATKKPVHPLPALPSTSTTSTGSSRSLSASASFPLSSEPLRLFPPSSSSAIATSSAPAPAPAPAAPLPPRAPFGLPARPALGNAPLPMDSELPGGFKASTVPVKGWEQERRA
ncbi:hypothetical protein JCM6882_004501 [Rhodosporidiobolus microsporus]